MNPVIRYGLWALGGFAAISFSFFAGLYLTFPEDAARDRLVFEFNKANEPDYALEIGDLSLWRLTGVALEDVQLLSLKRGKRSKDNPKPPMEATPALTISDVALRAQVLPLLLGQRAVSFVAKVAGGSLSGSFSTSDALTELVMGASAIDLSKNPIESGETLLNLTGTLSLNADLSLNTEELKSSKGSLKLSFDGFGLGEGSKASGIGLPAIVFSKAELIFEVKEGKLVVTSGTFESPSINATVTGDISLNKKLGRSRYRLEITFTLPADLDELARLSPDLKRARDEEGVYHASISGTLLAPSFRLSRKGSATSSAVSSAVSRPSPLGDIGSPATPTSDMSDEERRAARTKRIEERRERLRQRRAELDAQRPKEGEGDAGSTAGNTEPYVEPGDFPRPDELIGAPGLEEGMDGPGPDDFFPEEDPP
jgi:type II secretion system protein N